MSDRSESERTSDRTLERVGRGEWALAGALVLAGIGLALGNQLLVAASTLPLWYVGAAVFGSSRSAMVRVRRDLVVGDVPEKPLTKEEPVSGSGAVSGTVGESVFVRTTVQNVGSETIVDLRVIDGVPAELPVVSGTPRTCVTLEPLESTTLEYELTLRRGEYTFEDVTVRTRDLSGTVTETWTVESVGDRTVRCSPPVDQVPLGGATNEYAGEVPTDEGGNGVEFHSVREYVPGDSVGSIDWRRYANSRELATVEYRAERATQVICLVDARLSQRRGTTLESLPAVERSAEATTRLFETLVDAGHPTGVVVWYDRSIETTPPGTGPATRERLRRALESAREGDGHDSQMWFPSNDRIDQLVSQLPGDAQVFVFSAFTDDEPVDLTEQLRTWGYEVRVVSPDVTDADDVATRLAGLEREKRLTQVRTSGARVVDWDLEQPLGLILPAAVGEVRHR